MNKQKNLNTTLKNIFYFANKIKVQNHKLKTKILKTMT